MKKIDKPVYPSKVESVPKTDGYLAKLVVHSILDGELTKGWLHTHGMCEYDLPELEVRQIPQFMVPDAYRMLRQICDYMLTSTNPILPEQTMELGHVRVAFVTPTPIPGEESH